MRCYNCGRELTNMNQCIYCGANVSMYRKAVAISAALYNDGLERAGSRDLSGAIKVLKTSLRYNKENIAARNLLGLIYFEVGEVVDAISEWVISKNIMPENNLAEYYLKEIQSNPNKYDQIRQSVKKYNQAVLYCKQGSDDLAVIQLKKVITDNPQLIKAYQLMGLLHFKQGNYEAARKYLNKAFRINKTDATTLRYMKELDNLYKKSGKRRELGESRASVAEKISKKLFSEKTSYENNGFNGLVNIIFGLILGILCTVFLIVPAVKHASANSVSNNLISANEKITDKNTEIDSLNTKIKDLESQKEALAKEASLTTQVRESYTALYNIMNQRGLSVEELAEELLKVNPEFLEGDAKGYYTELKEKNDSQVISIFFRDANQAFEDAKYEEALASYEKVTKIDETYQSFKALYNLAECYGKTDQKDKAKEIYQKVVDRAGEGTDIGSKAKDNIIKIEDGTYGTTGESSNKNN